MKELRDIGFCGDIRVPGEIQNIKADIIFGLDMRELKIAGIGVALAIIDAIIVFSILKLSGSFAVISPALIFAPFFFIAKTKKNGMNLEDYFWVWYSNSFKSKNIRTNDIENDYEYLEWLYLAKYKQKLSKREEKKKQKEIKMKIKSSKYKGSC